MDPLTIAIAALAAGGILLIVLGLASSTPVDPVQARLTQLGTMQAKNLEELELQQPFVERTLRPLAARLSGRMSRMASTSFTENDREAPRAGRQPRRAADRRLAGDQGHRRDRRRDPVLRPVRDRWTSWRFPFLIALVMTAVGGFFGYTIPEFWLGGRVKKRQHAILLHDPGHPRPADDLRPGRASASTPR